MASKAEKLPSGKYRARASYYVNGQRKSKSFTATTKREAQRLATEFEVTHKEESSGDYSHQTVRQCMEQFIADRGNILSPSTLTGYRQIVRNAFPEIADTMLCGLKVQDIQKAVNNYSAEHSPKSVANAFALLRQVLKCYLPTLSLDNNTILLPARVYHEREIATEEQIRQLLEMFQGTRMMLPFVLQVFMGLRQSEVFALEWSDIDLTNKTVTISKACVATDNGFVVKSTKTISGHRILTMPDIVYNEFMRCKGKPLLPMTSTAYHLKLYRTAKKINAPTGSHAYRHFYASMMALINVPEKYAMERMGHSTPNMLRSVYQHTIAGYQQQIDITIDDYIQNHICATTVPQEP